MSAKDVTIKSIEYKLSFKRDYKSLPIDLKNIVNEAIKELFSTPIPAHLRLKKYKGYKNPSLYAIHVTRNHSHKISLEINGIYISMKKHQLLAAIAVIFLSGCASTHDHLAAIANEIANNGGSSDRNDAHSIFFSNNESKSSKLSREEIQKCPNAPSILTKVINKRIDFEKTPTIELLCEEMRTENQEYIQCYTDCETRFATNFSSAKKNHEIKSQQEERRKEIENEKLRREAEELRRQEEIIASEKAEKQRIAALHDDLRTGKLSPENIDQAKIAYDAGDGYSIANSPKIRPDYQLYALTGTIYDAQDGTPRFIGEVKSWSKSLIPVMKLGYVEVKVPGKLRDHYFNNARINGRFGLVGRYVGNSQYSSIVGTNETAAVFDAVYLDFMN
ncbi:hypothetical protein SAMN05216326_12530 [Nitrosomonas marina]|uniref:Uncharacterized protein n=1 Tax=Nitrosomonas marina TaxID=917 RepID=A0A1I0E658_9PROT|nr:hypothetical protein [Nitrosomonas marina]SET40643.1 hypothetical protein SAMN05216326_12530 [Nitrosomonas marina]